MTVMPRRFSASLSAQIREHLFRAVHAGERDSAFGNRNGDPPGSRHQFEDVAVGLLRFLDEKGNIVFGRDQKIINFGKPRLNQTT